MFSKMLGLPACSSDSSVASDSPATSDTSALPPMRPGKRYYLSGLRSVSVDGSDKQYVWLVRLTVPFTGSNVSRFHPHNLTSMLDDTNHTYYKSILIIPVTPLRRSNFQKTLTNLDGKSASVNGDDYLWSVSQLELGNPVSHDDDETVVASNIQDRGLDDFVAQFATCVLKGDDSEIQGTSMDCHEINVAVKSPTVLRNARQSLCKVLLSLTVEDVPLVLSAMREAAMDELRDRCLDLDVGEERRIDLLDDGTSIIPFQDAKMDGLVRNIMIKAVSNLHAINEVQERIEAIQHRAVQGATYR